MTIIYDIVIVLMFVWLSLQIMALIIGAVIGGKLYLELDKHGKSKE
jgi:hypothetical protein